MGPYLSQPKTNKDFDEKKTNTISYCAASMQGWRNTMEDAHIAELNLGDDTYLFGVFDGHGGAEVALFVKDNFTNTLKNNKNFQNRTKLDEALIETFIAMDKLMITKEGTRSLFQYKGAQKNIKDCDLGSIFAGCTANVALIYKNTLYVANSGDSRSVLGCKDEKAVAMSIDHKPDDQIELKRIKAAGGFVADGRVNGNLNLSRAMGDFEYKGLISIGDEKQYCKEPEKAMISVVPDIKSYTLTANDKFLLMGCDGIWECKSNEELIQIISAQLDKNVPIKSIISELLDNIIAKDCAEGIGCDNMTIILITLGKINETKAVQQPQGAKVENVEAQKGVQAEKPQPAEKVDSKAQKAGGTVEPPKGDNKTQKNDKQKGGR